MTKITFINAIHGDTFEIDAEALVVAYKGGTSEIDGGVSGDSIEAVEAALRDDGCSRVRVAKAGSLDAGDRCMVANDINDGTWWPAVRAWSVSVHDARNSLARVAVNIAHEAAPLVRDIEGNYERDYGNADWPTEEQICREAARLLGVDPERVSLGEVSVDGDLTEAVWPLRLA